MIYIGMVALCALFTVLDFIKFKQDKYTKIQLLLVLYTLLAYFAGLRYQIGIDYFSYADIYDDVASIWQVISGNSNFDLVHSEYGFLLLNSVVKAIFDEYAIVLIIMAFLGLGFTFVSCYKYSPFMFLSIFLYVVRFYFIRDMGQIRSAVACAIILYSIETIEKRQSFRFLGLIILASCFHIAALIVLPVYIMRSYSLRDIVYYAGLVFSILVGILVPFKELITIFFGEIGGVIVSYVNSGFGESLTILNPVAIFQVTLLLLFLYWRDFFKERVRGYETFLNMYFLSTCWLIVFNQLGIIAGRVSTMLATVEIIMLPALLLVINWRKMAYAAYFFIIIFGIGIFYAKFMQADMLNIFVPYKIIVLPQFLF